MSFKDSLGKLRGLFGGSRANKVRQGGCANDEMIMLAQLAGFLGSHGIWCVSEGETLIPMLGTESADGTRSLDRMASNELEEAVAQGKRLLETGGEGICRAVLVYDSYLTLDVGKVDALSVEGRDYATGGVFHIFLPYRNALSDNGFAVYRPKFVLPEVDNASELEKIGLAFFAGVDSHEKGSAIWSECLDESM